MLRRPDLLGQADAYTVWIWVVDKRWYLKNAREDSMNRSRLTLCNSYIGPADSEPKHARVVVDGGEAKDDAGEASAVASSC